MTALAKQKGPLALATAAAIFSTSLSPFSLEGTQAKHLPGEPANHGMDSAFYNHLHRYGIHLDGPRRIRFPSVEVSDLPQEIYSDTQRLVLSNRNFKKGWLLNARIFKEKLFGATTWERIPAKLRFESISWIEGGSGSTAGISIHPDGERIEADPSFGMGVFEIAFEAKLEIPPFPHADNYYGICSFIVQ